MHKSKPDDKSWIPKKERMVHRWLKNIIESAKQNLGTQRPDFYCSRFFKRPADWKDQACPKLQNGQLGDWYNSVVKNVDFGGLVLGLNKY